MKYSKLELILHKQFLGNTFLSDYLFKRLIGNKQGNKKSSDLKHIFITGLARAGTTSILNKLYSSNEIPSLLYKHMPFILSPKIAHFYSEFLSKNIDKSIERFHKDGIKINNKSPECFDEIFWIKSFPVESQFQYQRYSKISNELLNGYERLLSKFSKIQGSSRILIKNNNNHFRVETLSEFFPRSIFLIMFREPLNHSFSLLNQHLNFKQIQRKNKFVLEYMNLLGHHEFGLNLKPFTYSNHKKNWYQKENNNTINYWLSQWLNTYEWILESKALKKENVFLISYENLCKDYSLYSKICDLVDIKNHNSGLSFKSANKKLKFEKNQINETTLDFANKIYEKLKKNSLS